MSWYWPPIFASSGFGIQVGQYTGASILSASFCHPACHAAGQVGADVLAAAPGTSAASASATTPATIVALMADRVPRFWLYDRRRAARERGDVRAVRDHRVAARTLQL